MAEEISHGNQRFGNETADGVNGDRAATETKDRGVFDFMGKKEPGDHQVNHPPKVEDDAGGEKNKPGFLEKLHRSNSSSSSSSDEEGEDGKKKKKGLKEKIKEKITGEKTEEQPKAAVAGEKCGGGVHSGPPEHPVAGEGCEGEGNGEKKGILDKIKEKLPGYHQKGEEDKEKEAHASY